MACGNEYKGNSYPHLRGTKCILEDQQHERHQGPPPDDLSWSTKSEAEIAREASHDWYRAPEVCLYPGLRDIETQHYMAHKENCYRDWKQHCPEVPFERYWSIYQTVLQLQEEQYKTEQVCGRMCGDLYCGLPKGHDPQLPHRDGVAIWYDGARATRLDYHIRYADGTCGKCGSVNCVLEYDEV